MLSVTLRNDGTGTPEIGNYDAVVSVNGRLVWKGRVEGHDRRRGWRRLLVELADQSTWPEWLRCTT